MPASSRRGVARRRHARRLGVFEASATPPARDLGGVRRRQELRDTPWWSPPEVRRASRTPGTHLAALPSLAGRTSRASLRRLAMHAPGARATPDEPPVVTTSRPGSAA